MLNALTYVTRRCPRACDYCALRDAKDVGPELNTEQWKKAFDILKECGISFNLILGNETWLLGKSLVEIIAHNQVPYALYTTCPEPLFSQHREKILNVADNLSCGLDWPLSYLLEKEKNGGLTEDSERKSLDAWRGFQWLKENYPNHDCQGTITVHRKNLPYLPQIISELTELGVFCGINFLHWNSDGGFDFFPSKEELRGLTIPNTLGTHKQARKLFDSILQKPGLLQNPEMLKEDPKKIMNMGWHCGGNPYGGPTIDADGTLRVCGYRKGKYTPQFTIFDLPEKWEEWKEAVQNDTKECPGCFWSYPWMYHYWQNKEPDMGNDVFVKHAGKHIPEEKWSERKV